MFVGVAGGGDDDEAGRRSAAVGVDFVLEAAQGVDAFFDAGISNVGWSVLFGIDLGRLEFTFRWHCRAAVAVWAYVASTFRLYLSQ